MADVDIDIAEIETDGRIRPVDFNIVKAYAAVAEDRVNNGQSPLIQPIVARRVGTKVSSSPARTGLRLLSSLVSKDSVLATASSFETKVMTRR